MRIALTQQPEPQHKRLVSSVTWTPQNELLSASDDRTVLRWTMAGEPSLTPLLSLSESDPKKKKGDTKPLINNNSNNSNSNSNSKQEKKSASEEFFTAGASFTEIAWHPSASKRSGSGNEVFAVGSTDGKLRIVARSGRVEKVVDATSGGALVSLRWAPDGSAIATGGEDGVVKVFSRNGMLRTTLAAGDRPVYALAWAPDSDAVAFACGQDVSIRPLKPSGRKVTWKAHDALVLCMDWNAMHSLIVTGAEDCKYRVWDAYGRQLFSSKRSDYPITAVRWCPDGDLFAVGSFNLLRLCDKAGWSHCLERPESGSVSSIAWTTDGTLLSGAGGNGSVLFGNVVERSLQQNSLEVTLVEPARCVVEDLTQNMTEQLDFRDRVVKMSLSRDHLVVATATQCCVFSTSNWNAPHVFDVKDTVNLIIQAGKYFLLVDNAQGVQVLDYEGRIVSVPKSPGLETEFLNRQSLSLCNDTLAVIDRADGKSIRVFDIVTGKQMGDPIKHAMDIVEIALDQHGPATARKIALIDRNRDLYITPIHKPELVKIAAMVDTCMWNDRTGMLAAHADGAFVAWVYPNVVYVDRDLTEKSRIVRGSEPLGKNPQLVSFSGTQCAFRRTDGALVSVPVPPYPLVLYEHCDKGEWDDAVRMARHIKDTAIWASLAALAIAGNELNTAEVALAALDEVDKLEYILAIKDMPVPEARAAELLLYRRRHAEAEAALMQANLVYRAVKINIKLFKWERALKLAVQHRKSGKGGGKDWVAMVVAYRKRYLEQFGLRETSKSFIAEGENVTINWDDIKAQIAAEKEAERARPGAKPYA